MSTSRRAAVESGRRATRVPIPISMTRPPVVAVCLICVFWWVNCRRDREDEHNNRTKNTHENAHLNRTFCTRTFKNDIETIFRVECRQSCGCGIFWSLDLFIREGGGFRDTVDRNAIRSWGCWWYRGRRQAVHSISEAMFHCEFKSGWVDIDCADFWSASMFSESTC